MFNKKIHSKTNTQNLLQLICCGGVVALEQRLHEEAQRSHHTHQDEDPQEEPVDHHGHVLPVLDDLGRWAATFMGTGFFFKYTQTWQTFKSRNFPLGIDEKVEIFIQKKKPWRFVFIRIIQAWAAQHSPVIVTILHVALLIYIKLLQMKSSQTHQLSQKTEQDAFHCCWRCPGIPLWNPYWTNPVKSFSPSASQSQNINISHTLTQLKN